MDAPPRTNRWCVVGPTHPFRGGIPRHTTLFADAVAASGIHVDLVSYRRQYPRWLYRGESDRDLDQIRPRRAVLRPMLDPLDPRTWRAAAKHIERTAPDVIVVVWWHPFFALMVSALLWLVRRRSHSTLRLALCHNVLPHERSWVDQRLARAALRRAEGLIVHAAEQADLAHELIGNTPVLVTPHPTYVVEPHPSADDPASPHPVTFLFFGLIRQYKGVDLLIRALPAVLARRPAQLIVAGEFWDAVGPYEQLVHDLGLDGAVELRPGYVQEPDLPELLDAADVLVAPYRSATQSGAIEMAFGAGLPVVATRVGGLAHQVKHGVDGLLIPPEDVGALTQALLQASEPDLLHRLSDGARRHARERTWTALAADVRTFAGARRRDRVLATSARRLSGRARLFPSVPPEEISS